MEPSFETRLTDAPNVSGAGYVSSLLGTRPYAPACICRPFDHTELPFGDLDFVAVLILRLCGVQFSAIAAPSFNV